MAIVKLGPSITDIRGKMGHVVFSLNGSGHTARAQSRPTMKRSDLQGEKRGWLADVRRDWLTLTQGQIDDWNALGADPPEQDYNRVGEAVLLPGSAWHARVNLRRLQVGDAIESDAPASTPVDAPQTFGITVYSSAEVVEDSVIIYTEDAFVGAYAILQCSLVQGTVKQVQTTGFKTVWAGSVAAGTSQVITTEIRAALGLMYVGQKVFARLWKQSTDGIRSVVSEASCDVLETP